MRGGRFDYEKWNVNSKKQLKFIFLRRLSIIFTKKGFFILLNCCPLLEGVLFCLILFVFYFKGLRFGTILYIIFCLASVVFFIFIRWRKLILSNNLFPCWVLYFGIFFFLLQYLLNLIHGNCLIHLYIFLILIDLSFCTFDIVFDEVIIFGYFLFLLFFH